MRPLSGDKRFTPENRKIWNDRQIPEKECETIADVRRAIAQQLGWRKEFIQICEGAQKCDDNSEIGGRELSWVLSIPEDAQDVLRDRDSLNRALMSEAKKNIENFPTHLLQIRNRLGLSTDPDDPRSFLFKDRVQLERLVEVMNADLEHPERRKHYMQYRQPSSVLFQIREVNLQNSHALLPTGTYYIGWTKHMEFWPSMYPEIYLILVNGSIQGNTASKRVIRP